jgi:hypothetical protein
VTVEVGVRPFVLNCIDTPLGVKTVKLPVPRAIAEATLTDVRFAVGDKVIRCAT